MTESLILIEGSGVSKEDLNISLSNAKQVIVGNVPGFGMILHVAGNSSTDIGNALLAFAKVKNVTGVTMLMLRSR